MTQAPAKRTVAALTVSYLLALVAIVRGFFDYPQALWLLAVISFVYGAASVSGPGLRRRWPRTGYLIAGLQLGCMIAAFFVAPLTDTYALLILPTCMIVVRDYSRLTGWLWIGFCSLAMSAMIVYGHGWRWAPQFAGLYIAAYVLMGAYSQELRRAEEEKKRSAELLEQLQAAHSRLREYADGVVELTSMRERNRIARDLHDSVTQTIFSMTLITQSTLILQSRDRSQVPEKLEKLASLAQSALGEMRSLITELRGSDQGTLSLTARLGAIVDEARESAPSEIRMRVDDDLPPLDAVVVEQLAGIVREALNNVVKHADATSVDLDVAMDNGRLKVEVSDNGTGFDQRQEVDRREHIGISSMQERAALCGARLDISSGPGEGTTVKVLLDPPDALSNSGES